MTKFVVTLLRGRVFNLEQERGPRMIGFPALIYGTGVLGQKVPPSSHQIWDFYILIMHINVVTKFTTVTLLSW